MCIKVFGKPHDIPDGVILERDTISQFPLQTFEEIWGKFIRPGDVVVDAGAYIGLISLHFAALGASVHAFEGSPRNVERLRRLVKSFPEYEISIHPIALSDEVKECETRFNDCVDREHPKQRVSYVVYDDYATSVGMPDPAFVKMDIEGMETVALKGMSRLIHEVRPIWQIECHKGIPFRYDGYPGYLSVEDGGFDFEEFERAGYVVYDKRLRRTSTNKMECFENYFLVPMKYHA